MAQFVPFQPGIQVLGQTCITLVNAIEFGKESRRSIMKKHGIEITDPAAWYSQEKYLNAFREIAEEIGPNTLFSIGKATPKIVAFPAEINNLEKALHAIDVAYHMNHRGGDIGYYKVVKFDATKREAIMHCMNPYPSEFDRGVITTMLRKFRPNDALRYEVTLDANKETRLRGADSCTYIISW